MRKILLQSDKGFSLPDPAYPSCCDVYKVTRLVNLFGFILFSRAKHPAPIFTISASNDVISRKDVPFGVPKTKLYILT